MRKVQRVVIQNEQESHILYLLYEAFDRSIVLYGSGKEYTKSKISPEK